MDTNTTRQIICTTIRDTLHAMNTCKDLDIIIVTPDKMGMCEEIGEVVGKINKATFRKHDADVGELIDELGDVLWYLSITAYNAGVPLESVAKLNLAKLKLRYPDGFDIERSKHEEE